MNALTDALQLLFFALGSAWFAVDLLRKLRAPVAQPQAAPVPAPVASPSPSPAPTPAVLPVAPAPATIVPPPAPVAPPPVETAGVPATHLAVIAAAVHHVFAGRACLAGVMPAATQVPGHVHPHIDWAREGRRDIFSSHRIR